MVLVSLITFPWLMVLERRYFKSGVVLVICYLHYERLWLDVSWVINRFIVLWHL